MAHLVVDHDDPQRRLSSVSVDHRDGGRLATRHLVSAGRRRLLFAAGPEGVRQVQARIDGCRDVVSPLPDVTLEVVRSRDLDIDVGRGDRALGRRADVRPARTNDLHAIGIIDALLQAGVRVTDDIAVVGYDDIPFAAMAAVPLTTVRQPITEIGTAAARLLLQEIAEPGREPRDVVFRRT
ncbi:substrate-binding domain-containing protein [Isoptericola variabilis]|uniref:substrate-binding domain-containing protein n=1 Tax=Isoptericola variabilis TaxID=139208 RepID=UPI0003097AD4|nr:substrate-binding domain-containing protein [Isoptericola variabilis]TWH26605.1 LacI family transcriptional regulator [Isoptericola variabilis J7]